MQRLNLTKDIQGYPATSLNLRPVAPVKASAALAASTAESFTVPSDYQNWALFISSDPIVSIWIAINDTAELPAGSTFASTTSVRNIPGLLVQAGDVISIISTDDDTNVGIELFPLND